MRLRYLPDVGARAGEPLTGRRKLSTALLPPPNAPKEPVLQLYGVGDPYDRCLPRYTE